MDPIANANPKMTPSLVRFLVNCLLPDQRQLKLLAVRIAS